MNIDTFTLQCFLAVADTGSITRAAERVGRTQSAMSQQMTKLENLLGKSLFIRGKLFSLNNEGEIFLGYARQIFRLHREVIDRFKEPELEGEVRFGMPENFASIYLSDMLVDFARIHPRIFLNIECDLTLNLFERFKRGEFDLVLVKMMCPDYFPNGLDVCTEKLSWIGHVNHVMNDKNKPIPLVLSPQPCVYRARAIKALDDAGIKWRIVFSSPSYAGTLAAVKAGLGVTVLPHIMIPEQLENFSLIGLPELENTHVSLLKHDTSNPALLLFEQFVLARLRH